MTLSFEGWLYGIFITCFIISCCIFGIFFIYKSKKSKAKLLFYVGFTSIFTCLTYLGISYDFLTILLTGENADPYIIIVLCYMWFPLMTIFTIYIGAELLIPEKKRFVITVYIILGIIFEIFLIIDPMGSFTAHPPDKLGESTTGINFIFGTPLFILVVVYFLSFIIFNGFGYLYKSFRSSGIVKRKFLYLAIGTFILIVVGIVNSFLIEIIQLSINIIGNVIGYGLYYFGLKEVSDEPKKKRPKKDVKVKESLFRITRRPSQITEEEVTMYRDQAVCLVCKNQIVKFSFICYCKALYCEKCARALIDAENACWVCNTPFDESKPVKSFKASEEEIKIDSIEKLTPEKGK